MPPKAQTSTARRGRPAKAAVPELAIPVAAMVSPRPPKKRGRPAKTDAVETATLEPPKKRGRPAKTQVDAPIAQIDGAIKRGRRSLAAANAAVTDAPIPTKKRAGRPAKAAAVTEVPIVPKKRGRPRKEDVVPEAPATLKRRGRPALDLNHVAGSPRVTKRASPPSKPVARAPPKVAAAPRINPKMRSRLRQRTVLVEKVKEEPARPVKKARSRPKQVDVEAEASAPEKKGRRGRKASAPVSATLAKKVTARPKTAAPRKRRGYTSFEVADKFAAQVKQFITDLQAEDAANTAAAAGEADDEGEEIEVEVELGPEDGVASSLNGAAVEQAVEEAAAELAEEDEDAPIDPAEAAEAAAAAAADNEERLATEEHPAAELAPEDNDLEDNTELPSETGVPAEIATVQDELDIPDTAQGDLQPANHVLNVEMERQSSSSHDSVDFHQEITEVSSIPQIDGSNAVGVFHARVDGHEHIHEHIHEHAPASEPVGGLAVGLLFSGQ